MLKILLLKYLTDIWLQSNDVRFAQLISHLKSLATSLGLKDHLHETFMSCAHTNEDSRILKHMDSHILEPISLKTEKSWVHLILS